MTSSGLKISFMGMEFHDVTMEEALQRVDFFIASGTPHKIFTPNVAAYVQARKNPRLWSFYNSCDLLSVDSTWIYFIGRLAGLRFRETVPASYLMFELLSVAARKNYRVFLLGSKPELIEKAVENLARRFPEVNVVGYHHGYFTKAEELRVVDFIARARPDILFIGMSSPLKEYFAEQHCQALSAPVQLGVGGTIDALAGVFRLPPRWIRRVGFEWFYHLCQEPRRLWRRYLVSNTIFAWFLAEHVLLHLRRRSFGRSSV